MPKMKTHSGAKKRFSFTGSGKVSYKKSGRAHQLRTKDACRIRRLRQDGIMTDTTAIETMKKLMPYA
ncbi:50S ribosomal protein L35 [Dethiosulfovibrio salsuginis]|uniref:Large ribosomal subunit protein bL35 n=1 Tax=Dethiosulfovibrio salsuginis TaxID=561720 RepID=A0A1X7KI07_9BACT|nr:50S ribosomal protein L35 [Dethiosulfovibrio salsuginis]SMG40573.1 large subunit ribosomal protein L35 [Dethiosulfovibrio salsuginis]